LSPDAFIESDMHVEAYSTSQTPYLDLGERSKEGRREKCVGREKART